MTNFVCFNTKLHGKTVGQKRGLKKPWPTSTKRPTKIAKGLLWWGLGWKHVFLSLANAHQAQWRSILRLLALFQETMEAILEYACWIQFNFLQESAFIGFYHTHNLHLETFFFGRRLANTFFTFAVGSISTLSQYVCFFSTPHGHQFHNYWTGQNLGPGTKSFNLLVSYIKRPTKFTNALIRNQPNKIGP